VEHEQIIDRRARIADPAREHVGRLHREAGTEQAVVKRHVAGRDGARGGVPDHLADAEILEEIAGAGLRHHGFRHNLASPRCYSAGASPTAPAGSRAGRDGGHASSGPVIT
jgi:hypothetical protein